MTSSRISYFDYLNVFSCISIIALHCNNVFHSYSHDSLWQVAAVVQVLFYCAVPVFFMLSGATLLKYPERYSTKEFYRKRIKKAVLPYLFFTVVFFLLKIGATYLKNEAITYGPLDLLRMLSDGSAPYSNFWFFIPLFMLYLFMPLFAYIAAYASKKKLLFFLGVMIFFAGIYPIAAHFLGLGTPSMPIGGYALYLFLGYFLHAYDFEKDNRILTTVCILAAAAFIVRYILLVQFADHEIPLLRSYFGLYAIIPSMAIFMLFKRFLNNQDKKGIATQLSALSFGVFLIQAFVIVIFETVSERLGLNGIWLQTVGIVIIYLSCCAIVSAVRRISFLKWMFS